MVFEIDTEVMHNGKRVGYVVYSDEATTYVEANNGVEHEYATKSLQKWEVNKSEPAVRVTTEAKNVYGEFLEEQVQRALSSNIMMGVVHGLVGELPVDVLKARCEKFMRLFEHEVMMGSGPATAANMLFNDAYKIAVKALNMATEIDVSGGKISPEVRDLAATVYASDLYKTAFYCSLAEIDGRAALDSIDKADRFPTKFIVFLVSKLETLRARLGQAQAMNPN